MIDFDVFSFKLPTVSFLLSQLKISGVCIVDLKQENAGRTYIHVPTHPAMRISHDMTDKLWLQENCNYFQALLI